MRRVFPSVACALAFLVVASVSFSADAPQWPPSGQQPPPPPGGGFQQGPPGGFPQGPPGGPPPGMLPDGPRGGGFPQGPPGMFPPGPQGGPPQAGPPGGFPSGPPGGQQMPPPGFMPPVICGFGFTMDFERKTCVPVPMCRQGYTRWNPAVSRYEPKCDCYGVALEDDPSSDEPKVIKPYLFDDATGRCVDSRWPKQK